MNLGLNLFADWEVLIHKKIVALKIQGFSFEGYETWKSRKLNGYAVQKAQIEKESGDSSIIDGLQTESSLQQQFKVDQIHKYLDFEYRLISVTPRTIRYSKNFYCPNEHKLALQILEQEIRSGKSLFPRLSRQIVKADQQDGMLFDWGVYHLHLGLVPDPRNPKLVKGTKEILYLLVSDSTAYFLRIDDHGHWADKEIFRTIKNDFPEFVEPYKIKGILKAEHDVTEEEQMLLRRSGVSTFTEIDGEYYFSPGGGINSAKGSMLSTLKIQQVIHWYSQAEGLVQEVFPKFLDQCTDPRIKKIPEFDFHLETLDNDRITIWDRVNRIQVNIPYTKNRDGFEAVEVNAE